MDKDIVIRQGSTLDFIITGIDETATAVKFIAKKTDKTITETVVPENGEASFNIQDTNSVGEYEYQVNVEFPSGNPDIYPEGCKDCTFPKLIICESLED